MPKQSLFEFVKEFSNKLFEVSNRIEKKLWEHPSGAMTQARLYCEELVKMVSKDEIEEVYPLKHWERMQKLYRQNAIEEDIYNKLDWIRRKGNKAAHDVTDIEIHDALQAHKYLYEISVWYMRLCVRHDFEPPAYMVPTQATKLVEEEFKMYVDQELHKMNQTIETIRLESTQRQMDKEIAKPTNVAVATRKKSSLHSIRLKWRNETLSVTEEFAQTPILQLPVSGCDHLLSELSRIGIDSLNSMQRPMDMLHMKLNSIGPHKIEKFWRELVLVQGEGCLEVHEGKKKVSEVIEAYYNVFQQNKFEVTDTSTKSAQFENDKKETVYLLPSTGIKIAVHPNTVENNVGFENWKRMHNTSLKKFPKDINKGKTPTNYGYVFEYETEEGLHSLLKRLNNLRDLS